MEARFSNKNIWIGLLVCTFISFGLAGIGVILMGIPGAIIFEVFGFFYNILTGVNPSEQLPPDYMWPIALYLTVLWPLTLIPSYFISFFLLRKLHFGIQISVFLFLMFFSTATLPALMYFTSI